MNLREELTGCHREVSSLVETKLGQWRGIHQPTGGTGRRVEIPDPSAHFGGIARRTHGVCWRPGAIPHACHHLIVINYDESVEAGAQLDR